MMNYILTGKSNFILIRAFTLFFLIFLAGNLKGQVLISVLLGDELNSPKIEFGLVGGFNQSTFRDIPEADGLNNFNLGFYFHINMKNV